MQKFDFICIPDGRAVGLAIKAPTPGPAVAKPAEVDAYSTINMHKVSPMLSRTETKMYKAKSGHDEVN